MLCRISRSHVVVLACNADRNHTWRAVARMHYFAIYHWEAYSMWRGSVVSAEATMQWIEVWRMGRCKPQSGKATFEKLMDFTFAEGQAVMHALLRRIRATANAG